MFCVRLPCWAALVAMPEVLLDCGRVTGPPRLPRVRPRPRLGGKSVLATPACSGEPAPGRGGQHDQPPRSSPQEDSGGRHPVPLQHYYPFLRTRAGPRPRVPAPFKPPSAKPGAHGIGRRCDVAHVLELLHDAQRVSVCPLRGPMAADSVSPWFRELAKYNTPAIPSGSRGALLAEVVWRGDIFLPSLFTWGGTC